MSIYSLVLCEKPSVAKRTFGSVLPETLTSAKLTAEWECRLKQIERGEYDADYARHYDIHKASLARR